MLQKAHESDANIIGVLPVSIYIRLKMKLKGQHRSVDSDEVIQNKQLKDLSKDGFQECSEQLYKPWNKCVDAGGQYFEGQ
ncbi:uncharacterized protein TNCV_4995651 [Trichonephila clavipes]|nr:uncharacterized protein TNCV_4995651 [Trichonephila clavipes]